MADSRTVVTQVFPDEFHLHTLDDFLSATSRLNPHVNIKRIVVGLMDRLSAYAQRETESETPEHRQQREDEAIAKLVELMQLPRDRRKSSLVKSSSQNGDGAEESHVSAEDASTAAVHTPTTSDTETDSESKKTRGIPTNVKLFEIFHEQVANLVKMQRLTIQDTVALLVSLANLSL